jgi:hypothetical protein
LRAPEFELEFELAEYPFDAGTIAVKLAAIVSSPSRRVTVGGDTRCPP